MTMFANQYAYKVFNKDFEQPLFSNYFDGTDGWYRVGYSNRLNYGYGPSDLSIASLTGGFAYWSIYNSDVRLITNSLYCLIHSDDSIKKKFLNQHYEKIRWNNDSSTNLPKREQLHNFANAFNHEADSATLSVLLSFYPSIGITSNEEKIDTKKNDKIVFYPNPVSENLFVLSEDKIINLQILDSRGKLILSKEYTNTYISINIQNLIKGPYVFRIITENSDVINKKIIII